MTTNPTSAIHPRITDFIQNYMRAIRTSTQGGGAYGPSLARRPLDLLETKLIADIADALHNIAQQASGPSTEDGNTYFFRMAQHINEEWQKLPAQCTGPIFRLLPLPTAAEEPPAKLGDENFMTLSRQTRIVNFPATSSSP